MVSQSRVAVMLLGFVLFGCSQKFDDPVDPIPFELFSLSGTGCYWNELNYPHDNEVVIINSREKLADYITCGEDRFMPSVDFSQYVLLLARGVTPYGNRAIIHSLQQSPIRGYVMNVELELNLAAVISNWQVAIITNKIEDSEDIRLHIIQSE